MEFLYFPEDKMEYIPSFIMLVIFMVGAIAAMYFLYKRSKKEETYFDEKYKDYTQFIENDKVDADKKLDNDEE